MENPLGFPFEDALCIYVDKQDLAGDQNSLGRFATSKDGNPVEVCGRFSEPVIRVLATLFDLANRPHMNKPAPPKKKKNARDPVEDALDGNEEDEEEDFALVYSASPVSAVGADVPQNRIEVYDEPIYGEDARESEQMTRYLNFVEAAHGDEEAALEKFGVDGYRTRLPEDPEVEYKAYLKWVVADDVAFPESSKEDRENRAATTQSGMWFDPPEPKIHENFRTTKPDRSVRGHRFWFYMLDKRLNWDKGVARQAQNNVARLAKNKNLGYWEWALSTDDWIRKGVSNYSEDRFSGEREGDAVQIRKMRNAFLLPLHDSDNPARATMSFTFKRSVDMINSGGKPSVVQIYADAYREPIPLIENGSVKSFPRGAYNVPITCRSPSLLLHADLDRPSYMDPSMERENRMKQMFTESEKINNVSREIDEMMKQTADGFERDVGGSHARRSEKQFVNRFENWVVGEHAPPGITKAYEFLKKKIGRVVVPEKTVCWDDSLSEFGNMVIGFMMVLQTVMGIAYLHDECLYQLFNAIGAQRMKYELRNHTLIIGPPMSGKSLMEKTAKQLMTPGTFMNVTTQTKNANSTSTNHDCLVYFMDEAPPYMSEKGTDGAGPAEMKSIATDGILYNEQCVMDEVTRERLSMTTISRRLIQYCIAGNLSVAKLHPSLQSRFFIRSVPLRSCDDLDPVFEKMLDEGDDAVKLAVIDRIQTILAITAMVSHGIDMNWLCRPDMNFGIGLVQKFFQNLKGVKPDTRSKERVPNYIRSVMVMNAVCAVFDTNKHFAPGTPFEMAQIVECERYLCATREIVYFCISHMREAFVDINALEVYKAINAIVAKQTKRKYPPIDMKHLLDREVGLMLRRHGNEGTKTLEDLQALNVTTSGVYSMVELFKLRADTMNEENNKNLVDDRRRALMSIPYVGTERYQLMMAAVDAVTAQIGTNTDVRFSREMVLDIMNWITAQGVDDAGIPVLDVSVIGKFDEYGIAFSIDFLRTDMRFIVQDALRSTLDKHTDSARYLLGITYREGLLERRARDTTEPDQIEQVVIKKANFPDQIVNDVVTRGKVVRGSILETEIPQIKDPRARKRMYSHVFHVLEHKTGDGHTQLFRNHKFKGFGYGAFVPAALQSKVNLDAKPYKLLDIDYDSVSTTKHLEGLGILKMEEGVMKSADGVSAKWVGMGRYPDDFIVNHLASFDETNCESMGGALATVKEEVTPVCKRQKVDLSFTGN